MLFKRLFPKYVHRTYTFDFSSAYFYGLFIGMTMPFAAVVARRVGASVIGVALVTAAPYFGSLFACYWGHKSEGALKKIYYLLSIIISAVFYSLLAVFKTPSWVVMLLSFGLFSMYMGKPAYTGIMRLVYPKEFRGKIMGFVRVAFSVGMICANLLGGKLLDSFGYRIAFPIASILGVCAALLFKKIFVPGETSTDEVIDRFSFKKTLRLLTSNKNYFRFQLGYYFFGFGNLFAFPLYSLFLVDVMGVDNFTVGKIFMTSSLTGAIGLFLWGQAVDKYHASRIMPLAIASIGIVPLIYAFAQNTAVLYIAAVFWGIGFWSMELLVMAVLIEMVDSKDIAKYTGIHYTLMGTRGFIGPFLGVYVAGLIGLRPSFVIGAVLIFLGALFTAKKQLSKQEDQEGQEEKK